MEDEKPKLPRLPVRASIYIGPDGSVQFGALFEELVPVARALGDLASGKPLEPAAVGQTDRRSRR